jgi:hypothetical protein
MVMACIDWTHSRPPHPVAADCQKSGGTSSIGVPTGHRGSIAGVMTSGNAHRARVVKSFVCPAIPGHKT